MTANELFDALAEAAPNHLARRNDVLSSEALSKATMMARAVELFGDSVREEDILPNFVAGTVADGRLNEAWENLKPALVRWTPRESQGLIDQIVVRNLNSATSVAFAMDAVGGSLIVVDSATHDLTYQVIKSAFATWSFDEGDAKASAATTARTVRATLGHLRFFGQLWQPFDAQLNGSRWIYAVEAVEAAMEFVLAHEYAHILLGHTKTTDRQLNFGPAQGVTDCADSRQELTADIFAADVVLNPDKADKVNIDDVVWRLLGIRLALETIDLLDDAFFMRPTVGHPRPALRFEMVMHRCGLQDADRKSGALGILEVAEIFSREMKRVEQGRGDLIDAVARDPVLKMLTEYEHQELELLRSLDHRESMLLLPPLVSFAWLAGEVFEEQLINNPDPFIHALTREELEKTNLKDAANVELQIRTILKATAGFGWLLEALPSWRDTEWAASFMSPSPGKPYYDWFEDLKGSVPDEILGAVAVCTQQLRNRFPGRVLPFSNEYVDAICSWVRLMCMDRVRPNLRLPRSNDE